MLYPEIPDEELGFHDKLTSCVGAGVPVPVRDAVVVEGCALLLNVSVPLAAPAIEGLNVIVNGMLWPAGTVRGRDIPPMLKTELFVPAALIVTFAPLADRLPETVPLVPTTTLPAARVVGLTLN